MAGFEMLFDPFSCCGEKVKGFKGSRVPGVEGQVLKPFVRLSCA
jgi:hypothetical protein